MKLLFDENLSPKLVLLLRFDFPKSSQVDLLGLRGATDRKVWDYAKENHFILVSKDNDFRQRAFLLGPPPKVIWLSVGNAGTKIIASLLRENVAQVEAFSQELEEGLLVLGLL